MINSNIGIVGVGNMGQAVLRGLLAKGLILPDKLLMNDSDEKKSQKASAKYGVKSASLEDVAGSVEYVVLAVKPQDSSVVLDSLSGRISGKTLISIMAGVTIGSINKIVGDDVAVVRAMPNLAAIEGESITAVAGNAFCNDLGDVKYILSSIGKVIDVPEPLFDAVTAVSGSGPAYVFYLAEAMMAAAMEFGITEEHSRDLVVQTVIGAGKLLGKLEDTPENLRRKVTSKGGTTEAAIRTFDGNNIKETILSAMSKAKERSEELSKNS